MQSHTNSLFADKGYSFEDILKGGNLGGRTAVVSYLGLRIKQLTRIVEEPEPKGSDRARILLSIRAMTEAQKIALNLRAD